jgi:hypothetical protein
LEQQLNQKTPQEALHSKLEAAPQAIKTQTQALPIQKFIQTTYLTNLSF